MMRSLYSAVSGLKTHQTKMDVIGNNIANVNTVGFKSSSVTFSDIMYQTLSSASGANALTGKGGINAKQIGLGVTTGSTSVSIGTAGAAQTTGNPFDIKLTDSNSTNFFIVNNGSENLFTRSGSFYVDGAGNLAMTSTGYNVMGWGVDATTGEIKKDTVQKLQIMSPTNLYSDPEATTNAYVSGVIDSNDSDVKSTAGKTISTTIYDQLGYKYTAKFTIKTVTPADPGYNSYTLDLASIQDSNQNDVTASMGTAFAQQKLYYNVADGSFAGIGNAASTAPTAGTNSVTIQTDTFAGGNFGTTPITVSFAGTSNYNNNGTSTIAMKTGVSSSDTTGSGKKLGSLTGVSIDSTGKIYGTYSNGNTRLLSQIAVTQFANASGLEKVGENCYTTTLNSGDFDGIGTDISADGSKMATGQLEMSNVDLSTEFTEMITTQRGFQANSRIITTSDSLLEELINLKRS